MLPAAAALGLFAPGARGDEPAARAQQEKSFEKEITVKVKLNYLLYLPKGYERVRTRTGR